MAVHVATVGWDHPSRILPSLLEGERPERVVFICSESDVKRDREVGATIGRHMVDRLAELHIPASVVKVNPLDTTAVIKELVGVEASTSSRIHINITGGTKIMVVAAMMHALLSDKVERVYYAMAEEYGTPLGDRRMTPATVAAVPKEEFISWGFKGNLNVPTLSAMEKATDDVARKLILVLQEEQDGFASVGEFAHSASMRANVSVATVRGRLATLRDANVVNVQTEVGRREAKPTLSDQGFQIAAILQLVFGNDGKPPHDAAVHRVRIVKR